MQHERGDVPGPSTNPSPHAPTGEPASAPTPVPQPPLGYDETGQPDADPAKSPSPVPGKYPVPSAGEKRQGMTGTAKGNVFIPGNDS